MDIINEEKSFIDVVFPSKSATNFSIFKNNDILSNYHIWVRISDTGGGEDLIKFKSEDKSFFQNEVSEEHIYPKGFKPWNWESSAIYIADEIEIIFNTKETDFLNSFIKKHAVDQVSRNLTDDLKWNHKLQIVFQKSAQPWLDNDFSNEHLKEDFYSKKFEDVESYIWQIFTNDSRVSLDTNFLKQFDKYDEKCDYIRFFESIDSFSINFNGKTVHKISWANKEEGWLGTGIFDWSNCINPEYIEFKTRYEILAANHAI